MTKQEIIEELRRMAKKRLNLVELEKKCGMPADKDQKEADALLGAASCMEEHTIPVAAWDFFQNAGHGFEEIWLEGEKAPEEEVRPCGWCSGCIVVDAGSTAEPDEDEYNAIIRVWAGDVPPTKEQRAAWKWETEAGT